MTQIVYDSQRCACGHTMLFSRRDNVYRCRHCPNEYTEEEAKLIVQRPRRQLPPRRTESTLDISDVILFNQPQAQAQAQAPSAASTASTPSSTYNLRDEK